MPLKIDDITEIVCDMWALHGYDQFCNDFPELKDKNHTTEQKKELGRLWISCLPED